MHHCQSRFKATHSWPSELSGVHTFLAFSCSLSAQRIEGSLTRPHRLPASGALPQPTSLSPSRRTTPLGLASERALWRWGVPSYSSHGEWGPAHHADSRACAAAWPAADGRPSHQALMRHQPSNRSKVPSTSPYPPPSPRPPGHPSALHVEAGGGGARPAPGACRIRRQAPPSQKEQVQSSPTSFMATPTTPLLHPPPCTQSVLSSPGGHREGAQHECLVCLLLKRWPAYLSLMPVCVAPCSGHPGKPRTQQ